VRIGNPAIKNDSGAILTRKKQATAIVEQQYGGNGSQDANSTVGGAEPRE